MVTTGILPLQGKIPMVEPGIEPGTSWLVLRSSDHPTTRLVHITLADDKSTKSSVRFFPHLDDLQQNPL